MTLGCQEEVILTDKSETMHFSSNREMELVLGINDRNLPYLELLLNVNLALRGNQISALDPSPLFIPYMTHLINISKNRSEAFTESELFMEFQALEGGATNKEDDPIISAGNRSVHGKSKNQKRYISSLFENQIIFGIGPAGTGKTFLAIAYALSELLSGHKQKIVLTRPVVEAGESLGFLPGDLSQKLNPYLKPLYDAMEYFISPGQIKKLEENGQIEISPLAYMRGRSVNRAIIILDEAQNTTRSQMKMFLTRLGEDSQAIVTGDPGQCDLPYGKESGLTHALGILHDIPELDVVEFNGRDIIRSRMVRRIIACYEGGILDN